jgi:hypothetical protein
MAAGIRVTKAIRIMVIKVSKVVTVMITRVSKAIRIMIIKLSKAVGGLRVRNMQEPHQHNFDSWLLNL